MRGQARLEMACQYERVQATMVYVTHEQNEAMILAGKIDVPRVVRVEQYGTLLELYASPQNTLVASFIDYPSMNFFKAIKTEAGFNIGGIASFALNLNVDSTEAMTGLRPEQLTVTLVRPF